MMIGERVRRESPKTDWSKGKVTLIPPQDDGYVFILEELELAFRKSDLAYIQDSYNAGDTPEMIGYALERDPDEIFLALYHLARKGHKLRAFGRRIG